MLPQEQPEAGEEGKEDYRVTVIDTSTGKKLSGDQAPLKSELEQWLKEHPKSVYTTPTNLHNTLTHACTPTLHIQFPAYKVISKAKANNSTTPSRVVQKILGGGGGVPVGPLLPLQHCPEQPFCTVV